MTQRLVAGRKDGKRGFPDTLRREHYLVSVALAGNILHPRRISVTYGETARFGWRIDVHKRLFRNGFQNLVLHGRQLLTARKQFENHGGNHTIELALGEHQRRYRPVRIKGIGLRDLETFLQFGNDVRPAFYLDLRTGFLGLAFASQIFSAEDQVNRP